MRSRLSMYPYLRRTGSRHWSDNLLGMHCDSTIPYSTQQNLSKKKTKAMTANELFGRLRKVIWMLTSGDIPVTINGKSVEITDVTLEGSNGNYWCDIKTKEQ